MCSSDLFIGGGLVLDSHLCGGVTGNAGAVGSLPMGLGTRSAKPPEQLLNIASLWNLEALYAQAGLEVRAWLRMVFWMEMVAWESTNKTWPPLVARAALLISVSSVTRR